jgi:hypothetical protein
MTNPKDTSELETGGADDVSYRLDHHDRIV